MNLRDYERASIRAFVQAAADDGYLSGRVLDYGCGRQPYRDIVEAAGGEYEGYDRADFPANVSGRDYFSEDPLERDWDAILCTQVAQYLPWPFRDDCGEALPTVLQQMRLSCRHLILTYPTTWPEVEPEDLHRFTKAGMERLLTEAGFEIIRHERRGSVSIAGPRTTTGPWSPEDLSIGYGVIARA